MIKRYKRIRFSLLIAPSTSDIFRFSARWTDCGSASGKRQGRNGRGRRDLGILTFDFWPVEEKLTAFVGTTWAARWRELGGGFKTERVSHKRGFSSQLLYLFSTLLSIDLFHPSLSFSLRCFLIKARAAYEDARRAKERLGLGKGRRRSSYDPPQGRLSFVCTASIVCRCLPIRVRISCLPQVTSRPPMHDSNLTIDRFSPWPRERVTIEFEATLRALGLAAFLPFSVLWPFYLLLLSRLPYSRTLRGKARLSNTSSK